MMPLAVESVRRHSAAHRGHARGGVEELRRRGIKIGASTGYFTEAAEALPPGGGRAGLPAGRRVLRDRRAGRRDRRHGWCIATWRRLGVYPAEAVLKVGDTVPDIDEGLNAGCWSVGVAATGNEMGLTEAELATLAASERARRTRRHPREAARCGGA